MEKKKEKKIKMPFTEIQHVQIYMQSAFSMKKKGVMTYS